MGLNQVKSEILNDAEKEADRIKEEAREKADEIEEEALQKADKIREETEEELEQKKDAMRKKQLSNARMKARKLELKEKEKKIDEAFRSFKEKLRDIDGDQKESFVSNCIERANFEIGEVKAGENFLDAVEENGFEPEEEDVEGVVLISDDEERSMEFTVEKITQNFRQEYRGEVAETLFE